MRILVAEDNAQGLYLLEKYFVAREHEVWSAVNGREALDLCRTRGVPDVIVSDALMPVCDGFELCDAVRRDALLCGVPFILYTATYTAESDERMALSLGADRFVVKPIEPDRLLDIVVQVVAQSGATAERRRTPREPRAELLQDYNRMVSIKLEDKLIELSRANDALRASEEAVRLLNERLLATVRRLEVEIEDRRRAEELLRLAQQAGGIGNWECDAAGEMRWSSEALAVIGCTPGDAPATLRDFLAAVDCEHRPATERAMRAAEAESTGDLEIRVTCGGSPTRDILLRGALVSPRAGLPVRRIGIVQDIMARKEAEARRKTLEIQLYRSQKMEALGKLAGGVAHDFNNVLTAILCNADLLKGEIGVIAERPAVAESLTMLNEAVTQAKGFIRQILTFSRRESIERQTMALGRVVEDALRLIRSTLGRTISVTAEIDHDVHVLGNENQVHQILLNLCTNGAQAMATSGGSITVVLASVTVGAGGAPGAPGLRPGSYARLEVRDTGPGIDPALIEQIFEPFFTTKPEGEGTGLGLAVVHSIVQAHEGAITVESVPGEGAAFIIYLPEVAVPELCANPSVKMSVGSRIVATQGASVLIVDDEPSVARVCGQLVERLGYKGVVVTDAQEARELFAREPGRFCAAVVDFLMPRITGADLARAFWAVRPGFPVILVAGYGAQIDAVRARADGFADFVPKPFTASSLGESLARSLAAAAAAPQHPAGNR